MSRQADEKNVRGPRSNGSAAKKSNNSIYTFHPTVEQRSELMETAFDLHWAVEVINSALSKDITISAALHADKDSLWVIARTNEENWQERRAVSVWHNDLERALIGLAYYLSRVNPEWPDKVNTAQQLKFDW